MYFIRDTHVSFLSLHTIINTPNVVYVPFIKLMMIILGEAKNINRQLYKTALAYRMCCYVRKCMLCYSCSLYIRRYSEGEIPNSFLKLMVNLLGELKPTI
jgi:hypothetical protein